MRALERLFGSRPARIGIILVWLILGGLGGSFAQRFQDVQKNEESSFLPGSSESVRELTLAKRFPSGERFAAITVVRRDGGLKPRDLRSEAELAICWARLPEGVTCTRTGSASPTGLPATSRRPTRRPRSPPPDVFPTRHQRHPITVLRAGQLQPVTGSTAAVPSVARGGL